MGQLARSTKGAWVITGAASGFGRRFAERLAAQGARLALWDRDADGLAETAASLSVPCTTSVVDVCDTKAVHAAAEESARAHDGLAHVISSAGILRVGDALEVSEGERRAMMDINFHGSVAVAHACVPYLRAAPGRSVLLFIASVAGMRGFPGLAAYGASKFAVLGYGQALREELHGTGVDVRVLCPPAGDTPMVRNIEKMPPVYRLSKLASAEEVVSAALAALDTSTWQILVDRRSKLVGGIDRLVPGLVDRVVRLAKD